ncbi:hypothetical protein R6Q59_007002 [Mikania micrantha]
MILSGVSLGSKEVVHVHSTLSKQSVLKKTGHVRFDLSGQMIVDAPSFSLGVTQEGLDKPVLETPIDEEQPKIPEVHAADKKLLDGPNFSLGMTKTRVKHKEQTMIKKIKDGVFETITQEKTEIIFLRTLEPGKPVYGNIIDCWTAVLNDEEKLRSAESPHRLFCGHRIFKHLMILYLREWKNPKVERLATESLQALQLEWAITDNVTDCGIFAMRHTEMFMGSYKKFECGFKKVESQQKKKLTR